MPRRRSVACPPNGSPTRPPGWPGRTTARTGRASSAPSPGSTPRSSATWRRHERVELIVGRRGAEAGPGGFLARAGAVRRRRALPPLAHRPHLGARLRAAPSCRRRRRPGRRVDWRFNAWAKYPDFAAGRPRSAGAWPAPPARRAGPAGPSGRPVVLEGGSIDVNGRGTLLTTEECLLSDVQQRNPGPGPGATTSGCSPSTWASPGDLAGAAASPGDDTHGHVDDLARFVAADTVVTAVEPTRADPNHAPLQENLRRLRAARDQDGSRPRVVELPMPGPVRFDGRRLPGQLRQLLHRQRPGAGAGVQRPATTAWP